jgi:hypothetical protein
LEDSKIQSAILVFSKTAIRSISDKCLQQLQDAKNILIADPIDSSIEKIQKNFSACITTEFKQDLNLDNNMIPLHYLSHAPDWRLHGIKSKSGGSRCVYLGSRSKDIFDSSRQEFVEKIYIRDFSFRVNNPPKWSHELSNYAFHLTASKPAQGSVARPPTKLITALMLGATPIVGQWELGSTRILGPHFPYVLTTFEPTLAREEMPNLLNRDLFSPAQREDLERRSEELYCPIHHSAEWLNLFRKLAS